MTQLFLGRPWHATKQPLPPTTTCACCGSTTSSYTRKISIHHVDFMRVLERCHGEPQTKGSLKKLAPGLSPTVYNTGHLSNLWGLVTTHTEHGRGGWVLTNNGRLFLAGAIGVPQNSVATRLDATDPLSVVLWYWGRRITVFDATARPQQYEGYRDEKRGEDGDDQGES